MNDIITIETYPDGWHITFRGRTIKPGDVGYDRVLEAAKKKHDELPLTAIGVVDGRRQAYFGDINEILL